MDSLSGAPWSRAAAADLVQNAANTLQFVMRLETWLDSVRKNRPIASTIPDELRQRRAESSSMLASTSPHALRMFSGYSSGMSYDRNARFVAGVSGMLRHQGTTSTYG